MFQGDDAADTLVRVLTKEPDLEGVPAQVRKLLRRCLEKDPRQRLHNIADAKLLLEEPRAAVMTSRTPLGTIAFIIAAAALAGLAAHTNTVVNRHISFIHRFVLYTQMAWASRYQKFLDGAQVAGRKFMIAPG